MRNNRILLGLVSIIFVQSSCADGMGKPAQDLNPFALFEAAATWNQINSVNINNVPTTQSTNPWGGRLAGGLTYQIAQRMLFSAESGIGYYGKNKRSISDHSFSATSSISGLDILIGGIYRYQQFDFFVKGGGLVQSQRIRVKMDLSNVIAGNLISGSVNTVLNRTQFMPEIKVGGIYNMTKNLGISVAYMHAFGADVYGTVNVNATPGSIVVFNTGNGESPILDAVMFGLQYTFS